MLNLVELFNVQNRPPQSPYRIGILPGEGIGPQLIEICVNLLRTVEQTSDVKFEVRFGGAIGKASIATHGVALTQEVEGFCDALFKQGGVLLCGPGGERFVYDLRKRFNLFCKLAPINPIPLLAGEGPVEKNRVLNTDILVVRENLAGIYQGDFGLEQNGKSAWQKFEYQEPQILDILKVAHDLACQRRGRVSVVTKPGGVPSISGLWESSAQKIFAGSGVDHRILEVDNACYQIIAQPQDFDVVVAPNLFGDVIGDVAALLLGSRGMSYSANYSKGMAAAVYQTSHGAAHDLAGKDIANPVGQILSLAMLLEQSFGLDRIASTIRKSIDQVLGENYRTADIANPGSRVVGTAELGERINQALFQNLPRVH
jgi:3-isopropylmalate dehydrogenase